MIYTASATLRRVGLWKPDDMPIWAREWLSPSPGPGATGTALSEYLENALLDHTLGKTTFTAAATVYQALFTISPTDAGGGTEVSASGTAYARQAITNNVTNFPNASAGAKTNGATVNFGTATGIGWGTVGYIALIDAASGGNYYWWGSLTISIPIGSGDSLSFPAGTLTYTLD